jgi:hypothetical protein
MQHGKRENVRSIPKQFQGEYYRPSPNASPKSVKIELFVSALLKICDSNFGLQFEIFSSQFVHSIIERNINSNKPIMRQMYSYISHESTDCEKSIVIL